jgi:hypothetical protein
MCCVQAEEGKKKQEQKWQKEYNRDGKTNKVAFGHI